ncbi:XRE family transcriptional regulator [Pseudonocardia sp. EC080610-09]|uniref:XRE family transcriptional regulator n=1 Tax=unclassified Pseudonocardia TaxID=2619320 RepID=UPI0007056FE8|nr:MULTISPECIES: XRE family transcriptional regulator [unclassified Pseudonocardia]ALL75593.1 XRE family transcriptional regulator [Pseudonocardia sp. EC080610-09]ALL82622.1 XRE family transcriptional regulator [Pseudonocardia sp. EC080619-01]
MEDAALRAAVGERLRSARTAHGLSVGALAARAGIGKGSLSELENGSRNPTLSTLYALANTLGLPVSHLLAETVGAEVGAPGIGTRLLETRTDDEGTVEVYLLTLRPGTVHVSAAHGPHVVEHLLVTRGTARAGRSGEEADLPTGTGTAWTSDVEHTYTALGEHPAEAVLVIRTGPHPGGTLRSAPAP